MDEMLRIAVFGDSLMKGTLPDEQLRYHFHTDLFEAPLAGLHAEVTNKSVFGATSRKGVTLVQRDLARGHRYDWALVEYGGNDCNYDWPDVAAHPEQDHDPVVLADEFRANMTAIVQMLREAGAAKVHIAIPTPMSNCRCAQYVLPAMPSLADSMPPSKMLDYFGADRLTYIPGQSFLEIARPSGAVCTDCFEA